jgi:hypothetical protein
MIVYTCNIGDKDHLMPVCPVEGVRFICFSDMEFHHDVWEFRHAYNYGISDPRRVARMYKILSHIWFPNEETLWIDARGGFKRPIRYLFDKYLSHTIAIRKHHDRDCLYDEAAVVVRQNYEDSRIVDMQMTRYLNDGFPTKYGLHETGCLIRDNNFPQVQAFNEAWYAQIASGSKRDQLSFDYVRWLLGTEIVEIDRDDVYFLKHKKPTNVHT